MPEDVLTTGRTFRQDLRAAASTLGEAEIRFLVDLYYQMQDHRKATDNQRRASTEQGEPSEAIKLVLSETRSFEESLKIAMDEWTDDQELGRWVKSIVGIGPVIAAGLMAHIDVTKSPTAGGVWRFAGLDPNTEWYGSKAARELVQYAFKTNPTPVSAIYSLARESSRHPAQLFEAAGAEPVSREQAWQAILDKWPVRLTPEVKEMFDERVLHVDNAIQGACEVGQVEPGYIYEALYGQAKLSKDGVVKLLGKRPYNLRLKVLCWKIGESFVKQDPEKSLYRRLYEQRREVETAKNEAGDYRELAESKVANYRKGTAPRRRLEEGRLPDSMLHARCKRWSVKLFLSHYHHAAYRIVKKEDPPRPYAVEHLGHAHIIEPEVEYPPL